MQTTARYVADAEHPQNILEPPTGGGYLCSGPIFAYYIFSTSNLISTWYNIDYIKTAG